jgi:hypothetical protein
MQLPDQQLAQFLRTLAYLEDAGEDSFAGRKPLIIGGALCVDQDVDEGYEEVLGHLADMLVIKGDDLGYLLHSVEVRLVALHV